GAAAAGDVRVRLYGAASVRLRAPQRGEPARRPAERGAERRGDRDLEDRVFRAARAWQGDELVVRELVGVTGHRVDVTPERVLTPGPPLRSGEGGRQIVPPLPKGEGARG